MPVLSPNKCQPDTNFRCKNCGAQYRHGRISAICKNGIPSVPDGSLPINRPRTGNELKEVRSICKLCPNRTEGGGDYDAGLCKLKLAGCSSCKSIESFLAFQASGRPCPDKPPRFPGTELVNLSTEPKSD